MLSLLAPDQILAARDIGRRLGLSLPSVHHWLKILRQEDRVETTTVSAKSPHVRYRLRRREEQELPMWESSDLKLRHAVDLFPKAPFHFDATLFKPDHFPSADNCWQPGTRWQTTLWEGRPLGLRLQDHGTVDEPRIALSIWSSDELSPESLDGLIAELSYRYHLQYDLAEFNERFRDDPWVGPLIARWRGMRPINFLSLYEYLVVAIVLQNAPVRRTVAMMQALFEAYGTPLSYDGKVLHTFWEPQRLESVSEEELRALKIGYRARSIKRVSTAFARGEVDEVALRFRPFEEQRRALLGIYGVGPASAWYILSDVFHRLEVWTHISPWEQKIYSKIFFNREPDQDPPVPVDDLLSFFQERFGSHCMLVVHYIWEDLWWKRRKESIPWFERLIRL